jgi:ribosomal subunit interface protein
MDIEIQTQHVAMLPQWRALIERRLARLAERHPEMTRVHVTLKHGPHHQLGCDETDIVASCRGATLRVAKQEDDMHAAVHAALDALERQLAGRR